jgi:hypothetical protein
MIIQDQLKKKELNKNVILSIKLLQKKIVGLLIGEIKEREFVEILQKKFQMVKVVKLLLSM